MKKLHWLNIFNSNEINRFGSNIILCTYLYVSDLFIHYISTCLLGTILFLIILRFASSLFSLYLLRCQLKISHCSKMSVVSHVLGYPRIGVHRETKTAVEAYWKGDLSREKLDEAGRSIQESNWKTQKDAGLSFITVGDFCWYLPNF